MTVAIDTNIFVALWQGTAAVAHAARISLERAGQDGALVIAPPVYAELIAAPKRNVAAIEAFLEAAHVDVDWELDKIVWQTAALAYQGYARRRREQHSASGPRRILADFIIGAHAGILASALMTFDQGIYRMAFPSLRIIVPEL